MESSPSDADDGVERRRQRRAVELGQRDELVVVAVFVRSRSAPSSHSNGSPAFDCRRNSCVNWLQVAASWSRYALPGGQADQQRVLAVGVASGRCAIEVCDVGVARRRDEVGEAGVPVHGQRVVVDVLLERLVDDDVVAQAVDVGRASPGPARWSRCCRCRSSGASRRTARSTVSSCHSSEARALVCSPSLMSSRPSTRLST